MYFQKKVLYIENYDNRLPGMHLGVLNSVSPREAAKHGFGEFFKDKNVT